MATRHKRGERWTARAVILAGLAALALAGCGGSGQSNQQQIRSTVNHFTVDVGQGHYAAACKLAAGKLHSSLCALAKAGGPLTAAQCNSVSPSSAAGQACVGRQANAAALSRFTSLTISKLVISGSSATVAFNASNEAMVLTKRGSEWLIASA